MPVETVDVVHREDVDVSFDELLGEEVAGDVEVHAAVSEPGHVCDFDGGQCDVAAFAAGGDGLSEGLHAVEDAGFGTSVYRYRLFSDRELIGFGIRVREVGFQQDGVRVRFTGSDVEFQFRNVGDVFGEQFRIFFQDLVSFGIDDSGGVSDHETLLGEGFDPLGHGYYVEVCRRDLFRARDGSDHQCGQ